MTQATNYDKDVRIVAMDDLCLELEKDSQLSVADEKQYVQSAASSLGVLCLSAREQHVTAMAVQNYGPHPQPS